MPHVWRAFALAILLCAACGCASARSQAEAMRHLREGFESAQQGRYAEALHSIRAARKLDPVLEHENFPWETRERATRMDEALRIRDQAPDAAIRIALELIKLEPANPLPYYHIAWTYLRVKNDAANAEGIFLAAFKVALLRPDRFFVGPVPSLGTLYYDLGQKEKSLFFYRAALILNPDSTDRRLLEARIAEMSR